jgi:hypothetical protein
VPEKSMHLGSPELHGQVISHDGGLAVQVSTRRLARFVELSFAHPDDQQPVPTASRPLFGDNYFDLPAGRTLTVSCALPPGWTAEQAQAALRIRSLGEIHPVEPQVINNLKANWSFIRSITEMVFSQLILPSLKRNK